MVAGPVADSSPRKEQILRVAGRLFARHGFHGVSIAELGAAVGVSGPALYRHFASKEALLARMLVGISQRLLDGGTELAERIADPAELLAALVDFQLDFSLREPELITVHDRDLANLPDDEHRRVRALQRAYVEIWVDALRRHNPGLEPAAARVAAHGVFGLLNSTPHSAPRTDPDQAAALLRRMALAALLTP
ncbi:TetR/AcrR family transcriptional regulator [Pseudonocardia acaciae]|uniref:SACE_7040 family transcriptional regulator n=1 Tax=Pseudonocardia acaciae TaxID=551276 RepID=UPI00048AAE2F|nr:TetR/AcrR family transcriptional regulator [Pseudonocardia acaciae]